MEVPYEAEFSLPPRLVSSKSQSGGTRNLSLTDVSELIIATWVVLEQTVSVLDWLLSEEPMSFYYPAGPRSPYAGMNSAKIAVLEERELSIVVMKNGISDLFDDLPVKVTACDWDLSKAIERAGAKDVEGLVVMAQTAHANGERLIAEEEAEKAAKEAKAVKRKTKRRRRRKRKRRSKRNREFKNKLIFAKEGNNLSLVDGSTTLVSRRDDDLLIYLGKLIIKRRTNELLRSLHRMLKVGN